MIARKLKEPFLVLFILLSFTVQAQITRIDTIDFSKIKSKYPQNKSQELHKYSIGVKLFGLEEFPKILNQVNFHDFVKTPMNGIFLKINDNQISYRLSGNFYSEDITFENECKDCEKASGELDDFSIKIGFEKNLIYGILQPYFAFDIGYRRNAFDGSVKNASTINYTEPYDVTSLKNSFLMATNFGLKINPISHLTFSIEAGMSFLYSYEKQERTYNDTNRTRTFNRYDKWEFLLKPISLVGIQYNFGSDD